MIESFGGSLVVILTVLLGPVHHDVYTRVPLMKFMLGGLREDGNCSAKCARVLEV